MSTTHIQTHTHSRPLAIPTKPTTAPSTPYTPPDSPTRNSLSPLQTSLLILMRRYFALNLRADQKRTLIHQKLQQNRYIDVFHGPPYERVEDWNGRLRWARLEYERVEERGRAMVRGEEEMDGEFVEGVRRRVGELEELLREIG